MRSCRTCRRRCASRSSSSSQALASRKASRGTLASTTTDLPPARCTTRSGRSTPSASWTCSVKSQRSTSPASSTARRRCISPQRPRTWGLRRAVESEEVSRRRDSVVSRMSATCWLNWPCHDARDWSMSRSWSWSRMRPSRTSAWSVDSRRSRSARASTRPVSCGRDRAQSRPITPPSTRPTSKAREVVRRSMGRAWTTPPTTPGISAPGADQSRSTTTGAWSEGDPLPRAGSRSSRSMKAPVTRPASDGEATTKSILSPRSRSKRWR